MKPERQNTVSVKHLLQRRRSWHELWQRRMVCCQALEARHYNLACRCACSM
jgi:hypothetical protein